MVELREDIEEMMPQALGHKERRNILDVVARANLVATHNESCFYEK